MNYITAQFKKNLTSIKGFSLIELMVVIAIIAILAVVGAAIYGNVTAGARDARRQTDIDQIAQAMENGYNSGSGNYSFGASLFQAGTVPNDPAGVTNKVYCVYSGTTGTNPITSTNPTVWTGTTCNGAGSQTGTAIQSVTATTTLTWFKVCASLESPASVICKNNQR